MICKALQYLQTTRHHNKDKSVRINYIELVDFTRMSLNNIKRFKLTPSERIQLVLGTNGSGKSSLMGELSPLPAISSNYGKEGSKTISITHRNNNYLLVSSFHPTQKHSFLKNGEELNTGGTITVQKDLVKSEFGYRQDIHDLLTGSEKFSMMSPSKRRQWLTELCETNYDYAIAVYNRIAERSRDTSGALKLAKKRLVVETSKIISAEEVQKIQDDISALLREIDILYNARTEEGREVSEIQNEQQRLETEIIAISNRLFSVKGAFANRQIFTAEQIQSDIENIKHELTRLETQVDIHSKNHADLKEKHEIYQKTGAVGLDDLRQKYDELVKKKEELQEYKRLGLTFENPTIAKAALESIYDVLHRVLHELPSNEGRHFSSEKLQEAKDKEFQLKERLKQAQAILEQYRHQKTHLEQLRDGEPVECPKCDHRWAPGFSAELYQKITDGIQKGAEFVENTQAELGVLQTIIEENNHYGDLFREYTRCMRATAVLQPMWSILVDKIQTSPLYCLKIIDQLKADLEIDLQCVALDEEVARNNHLIELAIKANNLDIDKICEQMELLEQQLGDLAMRMRQCREQLAQKQNDLQRVNEITKLGIRIDEYRKQLSSGTDELIKATRNAVINQCLRELQIELAQKQNALNEINVQKGIVNDIDASITRLMMEEEALKILVASLSPHDGLIAEGLLGFIRNFVRKMNTLIRKIWTYKLEVRDCSIDSEHGAELDYKFPMVVGEHNNVVPDISKGSAGMREIIDLSFKIIAMQYLDLQSFPLFADEFGHAMDAEHKSATVHLIKYLMEHFAFSQLWMISHDFVQFTALSNTDVCVLCENNIVVPSKYNEHVEMA